MKDEKKSRAGELQEILTELHHIGNTVESLKESFVDQQKAIEHDIELIDDQVYRLKSEISKRIIKEVG